MSNEDIQDIINAKNTIKRASEVMAAKYKISSRRVYQIWRHPPIDSTTEKEIIQTVKEDNINEKLDTLFDKEAKREEKNKKEGYKILSICNNPLWR